MVICDMCKTELSTKIGFQGSVSLELKEYGSRGRSNLFSRRWHGLCDNCKKSLIESLDEMAKKRGR